MTELAVGDEALCDAPAAAVTLPLASTEAVANFEQLYHATFRDLSGYCSALLGDDDLGVDCAQEAFARLFGRFRAVRDPRAWLFYVATNLVRDEWRNRARQRLAVVALAEQARPAVEAPDGGLLLDAVRRLPPPLAEVVLLHYFADLPLDQVAHVVRRPLGTVKRRLHDARHRLHSAIGDPR